MGRHLSWILLNKVLILAHVAPFQTKLITHNSPGTTPPPLPQTMQTEVTPPAADVFLQQNVMTYMS